MMVYLYYFIISSPGLDNKNGSLQITLSGSIDYGAIWLVTSSYGSSLRVVIFLRTIWRLLYVILEILSIVYMIPTGENQSSQSLRTPTTATSTTVRVLWGRMVTLSTAMWTIPSAGSPNTGTSNYACFVKLDGNVVSGNSHGFSVDYSYGIILT